MWKPQELAVNRGMESGMLNHSRHALELHFPPGTSIAQVEDEIYSSLKNFDHFDSGFNDVAIKFGEEIDGIKYVFFDSEGIFGRFSDLINPKLVPVRVWSDSVDRLTVADTAGLHMLVGQRRWQCQKRHGIAVGIVTESFDQPRGWLNRFGMALMGATRQVRVWKAYLQNIKLHHEHRTDGPVASFASEVDGHHELLPGQSNPWSPREPYPGIEVTIGGNALIG